jgi:cathepsin L
MIQKFISISTLLISVNALSEQEHWDLFTNKFARSYAHPLEERARYAIFRDNLALIESHNKKYDAGLSSYQMAVNQFADMTQSEFLSMLNLQNDLKLNSSRNAKTFKKPFGAEVPESINWVKLGAVTEVKNQEMCGSCWSFSAIGCIEGQNFIKNNKLVSLSAQNLVDCSHKPNQNDGCNGGLMDYAFEYVRDEGIMTEADYAYTARRGNCNFSSSKSVLKVKSYVDVKAESEEQLQQAVGLIGPISVAVDASGFNFYSTGVYDQNNCGNGRNNLNHGILAVGYGTTDDGKQYWLVKNSWGSSWGEHGYIRMSKNSNNHCGIATLASYVEL